MEKSFTKKLWMLYKKDLMSIRNESLMFLALLAGLNAFALFKVFSSDNPLNASGYAVLSTMFTFGIFLFILIRSFSIVTSEWKNNTLYMLMPLPLGGKSIFFSKLMAIVTQAFILGAVSFVFNLIIVFNVFSIERVAEAFQWFNLDSKGIFLEVLPDLIKFGLVGFVTFVTSIIFVFFSSIVGRLFKKFSGLISFVTFIGMSILNQKLLNVFVSPVSATTNYDTYGQLYFSFETGSMLMTTMVYSVVVSIILFLGMAYIYDKKVEL